MSEKEKQDIFMELLKPFLKDFQSFARVISKSREDGRDLAQDAILSAYHNFEKLKDINKFKPYIFTILRNLNKRHIWRKNFLGLFSLDFAENVKSHSTSPETSYDIEVLNQCLNKLPTKQKEAIALFDISGFSLEEIKEIQGGTLSGVKSRLKRGRENLKKMMTKEKYQTEDIENKLYNLELAEDLIGNK
jgi:RNA polymerase sigma-70 factor (ECF subfamily)